MKVRFLAPSLAAIMLVTAPVAAQESEVARASEPTAADAAISGKGNVLWLALLLAALLAIIFASGDESPQVSP